MNIIARQNGDLDDNIEKIIGKSKKHIDIN